MDTCTQAGKDIPIFLASAQTAVSDMTRRGRQCSLKPSAESIGFKSLMKGYIFMIKDSGYML